MDNYLMNFMLQNNVDIEDLEHPTPEVFLMNYAWYLPKFISSGMPTEDTLKDYISNINAFIRWCSEVRVNPLEMTEFKLRLYREYLQKREYANVSQRQKLSSLRAFYNMAVKMGYCKENPVTAIEIKVPKRTGGERDYIYYDDIQMKEIMNVVKNYKDDYIRYRNAAIVMLLGYQGLRNIELHRLNDNDIDLEKLEIAIHGKGSVGRIDIIPLIENVADVLSNYLALRPDTVPDEHGTPLFAFFYHTKRKGQRMSRRGFERIVTEILEKAHLKEIGGCCHCLRHSCGTNLYDRTKDLKLVQNFLRHSDPSVTARYTHINDEKTRNAVNALADNIII